VRVEGGIVPLLPRRDNTGCVGSKARSSKYLNNLIEQDRVKLVDVAAEQDDPALPRIAYLPWTEMISPKRMSHGPSAITVRSILYSKQGGRIIVCSGLPRRSRQSSIGSAATSAANNISRRRASKTPVSGDSTEPSLVTHGELHSSTTR
jgi:hypothetical protein